MLAKIQLEPTPFETSFTFHVPDLNSDRMDGYTDLFEAVWNNDIERVKSLTLSTWRSAQSGVEHLPLRIAVQQGSLQGPVSTRPWRSLPSGAQNFSPFSLAILRGHFKLASTIVDICQAQYQPDDEPIHQKRWIMNSGEDSDDEDSSDDNDKGPQIYSELVSDTFTINDITTVSGLVKSNVKPLDMIHWFCNCHWFHNG